MKPADAAAALQAEGIDCAASGLGVRERDGRWQVLLADGRMAWFPKSDWHRVRMADERRILGLIAAHCRFEVPRVLHASPQGWDLRRPVDGPSDPPGLYRRAQEDAAFCRTLGRGLGEALAEQHLVPHDELARWMRRTVEWPFARPWLEERLPRQTQDAVLLARIGRALDLYFAIETPEEDRVLTHCDLGFHNLVADPVSGRLAGIFDYEAGAFADRCQDFRYLLFDTANTVLLESAIAAYEPLTGARIDRDRVALLNAASAVGFLAFRDGHDADEPWCGRTLAEDLAWTDVALGRLGI